MLLYFLWSALIEFEYARKRQEEPLLMVFCRLEVMLKGVCQLWGRFLGYF